MMSVMFLLCHCEEHERSLLFLFRGTCLQRFEHQQQVLTWYVPSFSKSVCCVCVKPHTFTE